MYYASFKTNMPALLKKPVNNNANQQS